MKKRFLPTGMLIAYAALLIKLMVFKDLPVIRIGQLMLNFGGTHEGPPNLVPFKTILPYLLGEKGFVIAFINIAGNIFLLVPIGFLVHFLFRSMTWKKSLLLAVVTGLLIEGMQAVLHVGIFDIDDVLLNGLGVMIGYWVFSIFAKWVRLRKYKNIIITTLVVIAAAVAVLYAVYPADQQLVNAGVDAGDVDFDSPGKEKIEIPQGKDPCRGTGGTGQIVGIRINGIAVKRHDGTNVIINFTSRTAIRNSSAVLSKEQLKIGDRVTVVTDLNSDDPMTATTILVCNEISPQPAK